MPSVIIKEKVLDGRGEVVAYKHQPSIYVYREWIKERRAYRSKRLEGARNIEDAKTLALEVAFQFAGKTTSANKKEQDAIDRTLKTQAIEKAIESYLNYQKKRAESDIIKRATYEHKEVTLRKHLLNYLQEEGITKTRQINEMTFQNYLIYRKGMKKLTWKAEIVIIKDFLSNWLLKHRLIEPEVVADKNLFPTIKIRQDDLMANPAINADDWTVINKEIRAWVSHGASHPNHRVHLWRTLFWHYTLIAKNTGARGEELRKLRWKDVEIRDVGRISARKKQEEIEELEAEGIEVIDDGNDDNYAWATNPEALGREERLIAYVNVTSGKTGQSREIPTSIGYAFIRWRDYLNQYYEQHKFNKQVSGNDLVFGNVNNDGKEYNKKSYVISWATIRSNAEDRLKGHKFSNHNYTLYSLRSTFVENKLLEGCDLFLLSRICGHDAKVLLKHYERLDIRERAEELTALPFGKTKKQDIKVELFSN
ncbi:MULTISPECIES: hypothetical protein [unclassified Prochlorococcus]|uniref:hypothetical protein n=1 Tax=unclassified Prochlorococcus TaxID=2627481 RepID=UPI0005337F60|nr:MULTISPECIES: hypothetical protein [unclassified Prochlorococcus]KGG27777.1 hypothetical protein EV13_1896 [Prochlorococcus sp. MIT 0702]KGG29653.1 hypothetical protein EV12_0064 [Prochlorococcus sp. MIT 0701]KGG34346.1 hypothetical protein EV14_1240 [Prochlorococcus sp. MIT 0703]